MPTYENEIAIVHNHRAHTHIHLHIRVLRLTKTQNTLFDVCTSW